MEASALAIDQTLRDFRTTDAAEAERHGGRVTITDDGKSATHHGNPLTDLGSPSPDESELPEVDFGFPFDQLAWALEKICGYDVRREVTDWLVGDVVEVSEQSSAWYVVGSATSSYSWWLQNANIIVAKTWTGDAATSTIDRMAEWKDTLEQQGTDVDQVGKHLAAAWASQWIPVYGRDAIATARTRP